MRSLLSFPIVVAAALAVALAGCRKPEVDAYTAPREERQPLFLDNAPARLLGAIVPLDRSVWYFKLVGPAKAIGEQHANYLAFLRSVRFVGGEPKWTLPAGWTEDRSSEKRFATIRLGPADAPLELTVHTFPRAAEAASVVANVNRWRNLDLGLSRPLRLADLDRVVKTEDIDGVSFSIVDVGGHVVAKKPPMDRAAPPAPPPVRERDGGGIKYETPAGWQEVDGNQGFVKAEAAFRIVEGDRRADVTVTFAGGDVVMNVNRWRGQVGLPELRGDDLRKELRPVTVDGSKGDLVDAAGPSGRRILGVIVPRGGQAVFVKMTGPTDLLERHKAAFEKFVASLRLN